MKNIRKILSFCFALVLVLGLSISAFCQDYYITEIQEGSFFQQNDNIYNNTNGTIHYGYENVDGQWYFYYSDEQTRVALTAGQHMICGADLTIVTNAYYRPPVIASPHEHHFEWQTITEPTQYSDGLEGEVCSCGATRNTQPISAFGYTINDYAAKMVNASKSGQVIKLELGEWNSFPKAFMEKVAAKSAQNVTFVFHYKWNHVKQEITIPAGTAVDTSLDWYGPAKMAELYGAN